MEDHLQEFNKIDDDLQKFYRTTRGSFIRKLIDEQEPLNVNRVKEIMGGFDNLDIEVQLMTQDDLVDSNEHVEKGVFIKSKPVAKSCAEAPGAGEQLEEQDVLVSEKNESSLALIENPDTPSTSSKSDAEPGVVIAEENESSSASVENSDTPSTSSQSDAEQEAMISEEKESSSASVETSDHRISSQSDAPVTNFQPTSSLDEIFQLSLKINNNLAAESLAAIEAGPHYDSIKSSFEMFQKALEKGMMYEKEHADKPDAADHNCLIS